MKTRLIALLALSVVVNFGAVPEAQAAEPVVCSITTDGTSKTTASPTSGTCSWQKGSTVLVTCTADIYLDSTTVGITPPTASSADQPIIFSSNQDPVPIYLEPRDQVIAVTQITAAGTCKFMTVSTRRPR